MAVNDSRQFDDWTSVWIDLARSLGGDLHAFEEHWIARYRGAIERSRASGKTDETPRDGDRTNCWRDTPGGALDVAARLRFLGVNYRGLYRVGDTRTATTLGASANDFDTRSAIFCLTWALSGTLAPIVIRLSVVRIAGQAS